MIGSKIIHGRSYAIEQYQMAYMYDSLVTCTKTEVGITRNFYHDVYFSQFCHAQGGYSATVFKESCLTILLISLLSCIILTL